MLRLHAFLLSSFATMLVLCSADASPRQMKEFNRMRDFFCSQLLSGTALSLNAIPTAPYEDRSFLILEPYQKQRIPHHEAMTAAAYSEILKPKKETLLMIPSMGWEVSGFDGVIFDSKGLAIANVSLKSNISYERGQPGETPRLRRIPSRHANRDLCLVNAWSSVERFSKIAGWNSYFQGWNPLPTDADVSLASPAVKGEKQFSKLVFLQTSIWLFGVTRESPRLTRIVIDDQESEDELPLTWLQTVREKILKSTNVAEVVFIEPRATVHVNRDGITTHSRNSSQLE